MKKLMIGVLIMFGLLVSAISVPTWYECDVAWAGCGGGKVIIVVVNPAFPTTLGTFFPTNSIMILGGEDVTQANRILVTALSALSSGKKVMVYTEPLSYSEIGGFYSLAPKITLP